MVLLFLFADGLCAEVGAFSGPLENIGIRVGIKYTMLGQSDVRAALAAQVMGGYIR
jgi:hypothetical protein